LAGFGVSWRAARTYAGKTIPEGVAAGFPVFRLVTPMFFVEFARIGNDSLCLFLLGLIFGLSIRILYRDESDLIRPFAVGVLLGLGLLTKAFFIPIAGGYALFMAYRVWHAHHDAALRRQRAVTLALVLIPALLLGAGWYVYEFLAFGSPSGSRESILLAHHGGLIANLRERFSPYVFIRDVIAIVVSWSWAGSWSLVRVSPLLHIPLLLLMGWLFLSYIREAWRCSFSEAIWLPAWLFVPLFAGLPYHSLVVIALGMSGTPGWYLNILAPFLAFAMGYGIERVCRSAAGRLVLGISLVYAALFLLIVIWSQMALFAGCAIKGDEKYYQFAGHWFCLDQLADVFAHLSVLGWPIPACICLSGGFLCLAAGLASLFAGRRMSSGVPRSTANPANGRIQ
jgi:hypothetical protein